ncbi:MAG: hydantoinase/oxoprolinase family protein, partial [Thermodesulfobacteriota bacterium]|nr:hydantoinase/oxoprolinase family protein [Thermodesulfobacteriota bacterium]
MADEKYIIYIDTGGTFSDVVIVKPDGTIATGKASTTSENLEDCFFNCINVAAEKLGKNIHEVISDCITIGYGTTVGTNMIVMDVPGPKLGFITTKGTEDRMFSWRLRPAGLSKPEGMHMIASRNPRAIIPRTLVKGVTERIDADGDIIVPLRENEVEDAVKFLVDNDVEGIAVGLLFSYLNNKHEKRVAEIIKEIAPGITVSLSSDVCPIIREYPRFMSTIIDLHIGRALRELLKKIEERLSNYSYNHPLMIMQAAGGVVQSKVVKPGTTLHSGPVGGLAGVEFIKRVYGFKNAMGSDVGGTSFDVTLSPVEGESFLREPVVGRYEIGTPMREIITIGAGGGTISWVDEITKTLHVGPQSAGSMPGPVCYDKGGTEPTVTDADVVMNRIDANYYLGGRMKLNRQKAIDAIKEKIADPLNMDVMEAAEGICSIVDGSMQAILKKTIASKGVNAGDYVLLAFGGMGPTHCAAYSNGLGFIKTLIPSTSSVFSAFGASTADIMHRHETTPFLRFPGLPYDVTTLKFDLDQITSLDQAPGKSIELFNVKFKELREHAIAEIKIEGYKESDIKFKYEIQARYGGQLWETRCPCPIGYIETVDDLKTVIEAFELEYLRQFTREAMSPAGGMEIISIALEAVVKNIKPELPKFDYVGKDASSAVKGDRRVYFDKRWQRIEIYDIDKLQVGNEVGGPAVLENDNTTVWIPKNRKV